MGVERRDGRVQPGRSAVVQEQAHPHPARRGTPERLEEQRPGLVVVPDVVLDVQRAVGGGGEGRAGCEGVAWIGEGVDSRLARIGGGVRRDGAAKPAGIGGCGEGRHRRWLRGARFRGAEHQDRKRNGQPGEDGSHEAAGMHRRAAGGTSVGRPVHAGGVLRYFFRPVCFSASLQRGLTALSFLSRQASTRPLPIGTLAQNFWRSPLHSLAANLRAAMASSSWTAAS